MADSMSKCSCGRDLDDILKKEPIVGFADEDGMKVNPQQATHVLINCRDKSHKTPQTLMVALPGK